MALFGLGVGLFVGVQTALTLSDVPGDLAASASGAISFAHQTTIETAPALDTIA
ncbi:hypothetical protein [Salininema proteolyticum]|uniref:Uncharacterized protein n=1 Tax=Salininema proteolyticum TaxID=1607685 RepID=A0ABV8TVR7_9ACTN